ncbi:hypothetical protein Y11_35651 [Yersinia enterocolitica subsp. palearctica Y11]|uniref:Uncharacterized protein n=1 Tax=Yersinia enterocolitica subsp. palearctica serotype O:3 (strain DSM 13030 / CIP 106945 / Y11) TaxID=930944 RepID=A0A0H3NWJ9_YERE1|nr:hypothetical protein IOK_00810 [Yersinia enterocolitica subsp. palearctica PhRBD_Ye1]CBY28965.1 hypothetical protein Y11_35651 [Yersinia enterocolitica subsp. palearctica Y11]CCO70921.1 hypothetical protein D322_4086 [Yersinia enterocolitica IP 10393]
MNAARQLFELQKIAKIFLFNYGEKHTDIRINGMSGVKQPISWQD